MREIKFRAWIPSIEAMGMVVNLNGSNRDNYEGNMWHNIQAECHVNGVQQFYSTSEFILMQFTGLKDKNGKDIYEGDIIAWDYEYDADYDGDIPIVKRSAGKAVIEDMSGHYQIRRANEEGKGVEVIGNIHQNPELL